jgi:hypothetical protein
MKIGIIGAGNVGGTLGKALANAGHSVMFGARNPQAERIQQLLADTNGDAQAGTVLEAVAFGEAVILAIHWPAVETVVPKAGGWNGKILIDATNRFTPPTSVSAGSAAEDLARIAAGARIIKAFNTIGAEHMANPDFNGEKASMLICGDDPDAKAKVAGLAEDIGFEAVDAGPLNNARLLESLTMLWVSLARGGLGRNIAFKILRRD